jgi:hypothetical protein
MRCVGGPGRQHFGRRPLGKIGTTAGIAPPAAPSIGVLADSSSIGTLIAATGPTQIFAGATNTTDHSALLEVVLNRAQPANISIQFPRPASSDSMSLVLKLAEHFGYPSYAWMTKSLAQFYERAWGKALDLEFPQNHLNWLSWDGWDGLYYKISSYEHAWIREVMRWYAAANFTVQKWHRLETIYARSATINLTVNNIGRKPATHTVLEATIYADNKQKLHYADNFTYGNGKISTFGSSDQYESDWYIDLIRSRCELKDKKDIRDFQILGSSRPTRSRSAITSAWFIRSKHPSSRQAANQR